jgi:hypothetical protein
VDARYVGARVLSAVLALGAAGCHRRPLQPADAAPIDAAADAADAPAEAEADVVADADADAETGDALACGEGVTDDPGFVVEGLSVSPGWVYVGSAVIVESTPTSLALTLLDESGDAGDRRHVTLRGAPAPTLPVGRIAWLTYAVAPGDTFGLRPSPWALVVRAYADGPILFGVSNQEPGEQLTPFAIGALSSVCSFGECPRTFVQALTVPDASPATIPNGGKATILIASNIYRLWVHAETQNLTPGPCDAASFVPPLPIALTYVAKDLAALADKLGAFTR